MRPEDKVIIEVGLNEGQPRAANPNVPYSPQEIALDARACWSAGAAIVHYHGRDAATGEGRLNDPQTNIETQRLICDTTPLIAYPTYGSHVRVLDYYDISHPAQERYHHLAAGMEAGAPFEMAPVDLGAIDQNARLDRNTGRWTLMTGHILNTGPDHQWMTAFCQRHGLKMTFAAFDLGHLRNLRNIVEVGWAGPAPLSLKLFLMDRELAPQTLTMYLDRVRDLFHDVPVAWMPVVYGGSQFPTAAMALGGHVRVGIGDYHYAELERPSNAALVERMVTVARAMGREPATPEDARQVLGMGGRKR